MNEKQFIEKLDAAIKAGDMKDIAQEAKKTYVGKLKDGGKLSLMLQAEEVLKPGQCLLDLTEKDIRTLHILNLWKLIRNLDSKELRAVNLLLELNKVEPFNKHSAKHMDIESTLNSMKAGNGTENFEDGASAAEPPVVHGPFSLKIPVMKEPVKSRTEEPRLSLYGLLNELFHIMKYRREAPEDAVYTLLMRALLGDESYAWNSYLTESDLHVWGRNYGDNAEQILQNLRDPELRGYVVADLEDALLTLEDGAEIWQLRKDIAGACGNIESVMEDWYLKHTDVYPKSQARRLLRQLASMEKGIGKELYQDITEAELAEKLAALFELALEAAEGSYPPVCPVGETMQHISREERNLLAVAGCGMPLKKEIILKYIYKAELRSLVEKGLLIPMDQHLKVADGVPVLPLTALADDDGKMSTGPAAELLRQLLQGTDAEDVDEDVRHGMFCRLDDLAERLTDEKRYMVLNYMVKYHWKNRQHRLPKPAVYSLEQLLQLMKKYPETMRRIMPDYLKYREWDAQVLLAMRSGVTLLEGDLACQCAQRCMELAEAEPEAGSWADAAVNRSRIALQLLEHAGTPYLQMQAWLILALSKLLQACQEAALPEDKWPYTAESLVKEHIIPAFEALEQARIYFNQLTGSRAELGAQLMEAVAAACRAQVAEENSSLYQYLKRYAAEFEADCEAGSWMNLEWIREEGLKKLKNRDVFQVLHRTERPAQLGLTWYCNTHDSTLACGPAHSQERTEAPLLQLLLSGQKEVMSANQMVDNPYFWNLAQNPHFLWALRRGHVRISMFGKLGSLKEYAVTRMQNHNFHWSSLPESFSNPQLRDIAAGYLDGACSAAQLPQQFREVLIRMRDGINLMDENLPQCWKDYHHQNDEYWMKTRGIGPFIPLADRVDSYYNAERPIEHYHDMRSLNQVLVQANPGLDRSVYRKMLWAIRDEKLSELHTLGVSMDMLRERRIDPEFLAAERRGMMDDMIRIVDDCQNRMLGERISNHQYYIYDEAAARVVPEWHAGPETDSGRLLYHQIEKDVREDGVLLGWAQVPERIMDLEKLAEQNPKADAEQLCSLLVNQGLDEYDVFGLDDGLRLKNLAFRATTGAAVGREYTRTEGDLYQVEKDLNHKK